MSNNQVLSDLIKFRNENIKDNRDSSLIYISTANMNPERNGISLEDNDSLGKSGKKFYKGDVLISNIRPYFKKIWKADRDGISSADVLNFIPIEEDVIDKTYLYYLLSADTFFGYMTATAKGTKMPRGDKKALEKYEVRSLKLSEQKSIANILSSFDDKIENNNAIIANLEEQAQAIFKSWFIDFEPFQDEQFIKSDIGLIPKTGKVVSLDNIAEVIMGVSPKSETYNNNNIGLPLLNGAADFAENSLKPTRHTSDPKRISQQGDWILCIRGTIGNLAYSDGEYALGRGVAAIRPLEQSCQSIIYHYILLNIKQLKRNATGSVISGLSKTDLTKMKVFIPEKTKLNHISNVLLRILKYQIKLEAINETLSSIRDILLPKLMSGEIRVEETIEVEEM